MNKKILILDDDQGRHDGFTKIFPQDQVTHALDYDQFRDALPLGPFDLVCLDHDLGGTADPDGNVVLRKSGMDAAQALVDLPPQLRPKQVLVHSHNTSASPKMVQVLRDAGIPVARKPYSCP